MLRVHGSLAPFAPQPRLRKYAPLASAIIPGSGQAILGNDRFVGYLAVEALAWWMYAKDISERTARERQFKELAREVARAHFSTTFPDADWAYYEWIRDEKESGVYSKTTSGPVVPETDLSTYNGKKWETLQSIYPTTAEALRTTSRSRSSPSFGGRGAITFSSTTSTSATPIPATTRTARRFGISWSSARIIF